MVTHYWLDFFDFIFTYSLCVHFLQQNHCNVFAILIGIAIVNTNWIGIDKLYNLSYFSFLDNIHRLNYYLNIPTILKFTTKYISNIRSLRINIYLSQSGAINSRHTSRTSISQYSKQEKPAWYIHTQKRKKKKHQNRTRDYQLGRWRWISCCPQQHIQHLCRSPKKRKREKKKQHVIYQV